MDITKFFRSQALLGIITISLLLSSYFFSLLFSQLFPVGFRSSTLAKAVLFFSIALLVFFLVSFVMFVIAIFNLKEIRKIFAEPDDMTTITITTLVCSYLSASIHNYIASFYGGFAVSQIFFYLSLTFFSFFVILFIGLVVSFSNKFIYSR